MELGTGFAYMGREVRIEVGDTEKFIDMLFYNTQRHCYVVVEKKNRKIRFFLCRSIGNLCCGC